MKKTRKYYRSSLRHAKKVGYFKTQKPYSLKNRPKNNIKKKMICSPEVQNISVENSCYTPKILLMIRDSYNKDHSQEDKIEESDPTKLWKILNTRLVHCKKEDCWLNELTDENLKKRIDRYIFAPDKPYEWKSNPNEWLSNFDIMNVLEQYEKTYKEFEFIGPTPIDFDKVIGKSCVQNELCRFQLSNYIKNGKTKIGIIFNLSPHTSGGSHWVSLFIDVNERIIFYFDSAGDEIPTEINVFVNRVQEQVKERDGGRKYTFHQNCPNVHQKGNTECGVYSLFFIITMLTSVVPTFADENELSSANHRRSGKLQEDIIDILPTKLMRGFSGDSLNIKSNRRSHKNGRMNMKQKIDLFQKQTIPDKYIEQYRNIYFND